MVEGLKAAAGDVDVRAASLLFKKKLKNCNFMDNL